MREPNIQNRILTSSWTQCTKTSTDVIDCAWTQCIEPSSDVIISTVDRRATQVAAMQDMRCTPGLERCPAFHSHLTAIRWMRTLAVYTTYSSRCHGNRDGETRRMAARLFPAIETRTTVVKSWQQEYKIKRSAVPYAAWCRGCSCWIRRCWCSPLCCCCCPCYCCCAAAAAAAAAAPAATTTAAVDGDDSIYVMLM